METKIIGKKIAKARKKINISQAQLAELLFVSAQAVGKWERGESMPDIITFNHLAEILGVDLNYFSDTGQPDATDKSPDEPLDKQSHTSTAAEQKNKLDWDMSRGNWLDADFSGLENLHEKFSSSNMQHCKFNGSDLSRLLLKTNNVDSCNFSDSELSRSLIQSSNLGNNIFKGCSLKETEFSGSNIYNCDFSDAKLTGTKFSKSYINGCQFTGADFTGIVIKSSGFTGVKIKSGSLEKNIITNAILKQSSFIETQIADIVFTGTLEDCYFENCKFTRVIFQDATLLHTFFKTDRGYPQAYLPHHNANHYKT